MRLVCGVGTNDCPGWSYRKDRDTYEYRVYLTWHNMLARCYSKKYLERKPTYIGCSVCERWLTLSNFAEDIKSLPNYDKYVTGECPVLDKDIRVPGNRVYSSVTCMFVSKADSALDVIINHPGALYSKEAYMKVGMKRSKAVRAINLKTNEVKMFSSQKEAAEVLGVDKSSISKVLLGKLSRCGNFYFERIGKD